jgi:hypothetical protein
VTSLNGKTHRDWHSGWPAQGQRLGKYYGTVTRMPRVRVRVGLDELGVTAAVRLKAAARDCDSERSRPCKLHNPVVLPSGGPATRMRRHQSPAKPGSNLAAREGNLKFSLKPASELRDSAAYIR